MNPRLRGALVGAAIGAGIGALYGFMFVAYRERMAQPEGQGDAVVPEYVEAEPPAVNGQLISPEVQDPERAPRARGRAEALQAIVNRAKEIQAAEAAEGREVKYRDAMRRAAEENRAQET